MGAMNKAEKIVEGVGGVGIGLAITLLILQGFQGVATGTANTTVTTIITYLSNTTTWINILIIVAFAAIVMMVYKARKNGI